MPLQSAKGSSKKAQQQAISANIRELKASKNKRPMKSIKNGKKHQERINENIKIIKKIEKI